MLTLNPKISVTRIEDGLYGVYVTFRRDMRAVETIPFSRADGARMNIDVDERDIPIGIEFTSPSPIPEQSGAGEAPEGGYVEALMDLFAFATQMTTFHRANQQARGNALIEDALESIKQIESDSLACA